MNGGFRFPHPYCLSGYYNTLIFLFHNMNDSEEVVLD